MKGEYSVVMVLAEHPWLVAALILLLLGILLIPNECINDTRPGRSRHLIRAEHWIWERRRGYTRLYLPGLRRIQQALPRGMGRIWRVIASDLSRASLTRYDAG